MTAVGHLLLQFYTGHSGTPFLNEVMIFAAEKLVYLIPVALLYCWFTTDEDQSNSGFRIPFVPSWLTTANGKSKSVFIFVTIVVSIIISYVLGQLYAHPAPYMVGYDTLLVDAPENSFPSTHTTIGFAFVWPLFHLQDRWRYGLVALVLAALVGISRVYVGVHYPIDIVGAIGASLLGFILVYAVRSPVMAFANQCIRIEEYVAQKVV
jgi:undecaprenyl-diphosphatase